MGETPGLLDDYRRVARYHVRMAVPAIAIRIRSLEARLLLARSGLGDSGASYPELLAAARDGDARWLKRRRRTVKPGALAGLAQTLAQQEMLPEDRTDALALYQLIRTGLGADALPAAHQGLHVQLALAWQGVAQARPLLAEYRKVSAAVRGDLELDLGNPFAGDGAVIPWLTAFGRLLQERGYRLVDVPEEEFESMGTNVLALAPRVCVMVKGNPRTRAALERSGAMVYEYEGGEISLKGGGGPTCLTRPLARTA